MPEQHIALLRELGVPQEQIDAVEKLTPEEAKTWKPEQVTGSVKAAMKNIFLNDNDFLNEIPEDKIPEGTRKKYESGQYTRFQKELLEAATKQLGLEDSDLSDLSEEDKKSIKKTMVKIAEKHLVKKGNVKGLQEMQGQVQQLTKDLEKKDTDWQAKLDTDLNAEKSNASARIVKALTKVELAGLEGVKLAVAPGYITDALLAKLNAKYHIQTNAAEELELKQKENPNLDAMEGGKKITFREALRKQVLEDKVGAEIKEDEKDKGKGKRTVIINNTEGGSEDEGGLPSYIADKVKKNEELEPKSN